MDKLALVVEKFCAQVIKVANYPTQEKTKVLVKNIIKNLKNTNKDLMKGVYYASNVELQQQPEHFKVSFILNVSDNPATYQAIQASHLQRFELINNTLLGVLTQYFPEVSFKIGFQYLPIKEPGWTDKEID